MKNILHRTLTILPVTGIILIFSAGGARAKELSGRSFDDYRVTSVSIGADITDISGDAFSNLHDLKKISVSEDNSTYSSYKNCLYDKDLTELIYVPMGLDSVVIPDTVVNISRNALEGLPDKAKAAVRGIVGQNRKIRSDTRSASPDEKDETETGKAKDPEKKVTVNTPDTPVGNMVRTLLDYLSVEGMSEKDALRICYDHMMRNYSYIRFTDTFDKGWTNAYASALFTSGKGNCASYAAGFAYLAKGLGFDSRVATGMIDSVSGLPTTHAWTEVNVDGVWYIFDAEMDQAKPDKEYYMKTYRTYPSTGLKKTMEWSCDY